MLRQSDMALGLSRLRRPSELQLDVRLTREIGAIMQHSTQNKFITEIGEVRQRRFNHDRLVDLKSGLSSAKLILLRRGDGDHAIAREAVWRNELDADASLSIGSERGIPERAGEKVLSKTIE